MPFRVLRGTFHVRGYSPDGDSIRFQADNENTWNLLGGPPVGLNGRRHAQLRLEGIDTLETHFRNVRQPQDLAVKALTFLLMKLGITGVQWDVLMTRVVAAADGTRGYVLSRTTEDNGRPVAFVFAGDPPEDDGDSVFLTPARLAESVNSLSLAEGLAYPTYYKGLFSDLRRAMTVTAVAARTQGLNIWGEDKTNAGFDVTSLTSITDDHVILPKLFRRLAEYMESGGSVEGFIEFLRGKQESILVLPAAHFTHFDNIVTLTGTTVRMTELPENVIFQA